MEQVKETVSKVLQKGNQAAWIKEKGAQLHIDKNDTPTAGADEIVVKTHAVAINPVDHVMQDTGLFVQQWPNIFGCDAAGEVHEVGSKVTKFKKGDRVLSHVPGVLTGQPRNGAFQHYVATTVETCAILPKSISYVDASVLPLALATAATGLYKKTENGFLGLPSPSLNPESNGKVILVYGGSSSVGSLAIQLAVASGTKVIAVASSHNHAYCQKLGASHVFDYKSHSVVEDVVKAIQASNRQFGGVYDAISKPDSYKITLPVLEKLGGGNSAIVLQAPESATPSNVKFGSIFAVDPVVHPIWEHYVTPALEQGKLKCVPEAMVIGEGLQSVQKGIDENRKGVSAKKVVIKL